MQIVRSLSNLTDAQRSCVVSIGNFDGVHLGHQAVLGQMAEKAGQLGLKSVVITFEPYPQEFFTHFHTPPRLTRFREKIQALRRFAVDSVLCLRFNRALAQMPAEEFIDRVLVRGLATKCLVVGDDFRFGHQRKGDFAMLCQAGQQHGFKVISMHTFDIDEQRVSSTRIRQALGRGDLATAEKLLGRPYRMSGRVVAGDRRGRQIGFPTANIYLHRRVSPVRGVFVVELFGLEEEPLPGVANVGARPTVGGASDLLEVHLLDFSGDIYGRYVQVNFLHKIRDEQRFSSLSALQDQIKRDENEARAVFQLMASGQAPQLQPKIQY